MAPFLVILGLLLLGVAIVAWHTREVWRDLLVRRAERLPVRPAPTKPVNAPATALQAEPDAFAHAPASESFIAAAPVARAIANTTAASEADPFAHAPALSELGGFPAEQTRH